MSIGSGVFMLFEGPKLTQFNSELSSAILEEYYVLNGVKWELKGAETATKLRLAKKEKHLHLCKCLIIRCGT